MLGRHRRRISKLKALLNELEADKSNMELLLRLQAEILAAIRSTELAIDRAKERRLAYRMELRTARSPKERATQLKNSIAGEESRLANLKWLLTIWRSFGDAIAFIYLDRWCIKHLLYRTTDTLQKQSSGRISGKEGLRKELLLLKKVLRARFPALMSDLTNCIRYGDVCVLIGPDPMPIEVKSSATTGLRSQRQISDITKLMEFFRTDVANDFRGLGTIRRVSLHSREIDYKHLFDEAIAAALKNGSYLSEPEPGLRLSASTSLDTRPVERAFSGIARGAHLVLNESKNNAEWNGYFPYTLAIKSPQNLYAFLSGQVVLLVVFDLDSVAKTARRRGLEFSIEEGSDWPFRFRRLSPGSTGPETSGMSVGFIGRMFHELLSWKWVLSEERRRLAHLAADAVDPGGKNMPPPDSDSDPS